MVGAFQLYNRSSYSRADGMSVTYDDVKNYLNTMDEGEGAGINVNSNAQLKQVIKEAISESNKDNIAFSLFNHDFTQGDVITINMMLNIITIALAIISLIKRK